MIPVTLVTSFTCGDWALTNQDSKFAYDATQESLTKLKNGGSKLAIWRHSSSMWTPTKLDKMIKQYARVCFRGEAAARATELATKLGMSYCKLNRLTHEYYGCSPGKLLRAIKIARARKLMRRTSLNTSRVAYRAAFGTRRSLFRTFKRDTGYTPRGHERD